MAAILGFLPPFVGRYFIFFKMMTFTFVQKPLRPSLWSWLLPCSWGAVFWWCSHMDQKLKSNSQFQTDSQTGWLRKKYPSSNIIPNTSHHLFTPLIKVKMIHSRVPSFSSWWFQAIWKSMLVKLGIISPNRDEHKKSNWNHQLASFSCFPNGVHIGFNPTPSELWRSNDLSKRDPCGTQRGTFQLQCLKVCKVGHKKTSCKVKEVHL